MKRFATILLASFAALGPVACDDGDLLGPGASDDVSITMIVSGGLAGVCQMVLVDGADGLARGSHQGCGALQTGFVIPLSSLQIISLAQALEDSGVHAMDGTDFGTQCCDQFGVELTYERGERSAHVWGTMSLMPAALQLPIGLLQMLAQERVPVLVSPDTRVADWPRDAYTLGDVLVEGSVVSAELSYSGGCEPHRMDLVAWGGFQESSPVQIEALVTHDNRGDTCEALLTETRRFDLTPLVRAFVQQHGQPGAEGVTIIIRLWDPDSTTPRLLEVRL